MKKTQIKIQCGRCAGHGAIGGGAKLQNRQSPRFGLAICPDCSGKGFILYTKDEKLQKELSRLIKGR